MLRRWRCRYEERERNGGQETMGESGLPSRADRTIKQARDCLVEALVDAGFGAPWTEPIRAGTQDADHMARLFALAFGGGGRRFDSDARCARVCLWIVTMGQTMGMALEFEGLWWMLVPRSSAEDAA
jgi:hypothetical protein